VVPPAPAPTRARPMSDWPPPYAAGPVAPVPTSRPGAILGASILTWVTSVLVAAVFVTRAALLVIDPTPVIDEMRRTNPDLLETAGVTADLIRVLFVLIAGGVLLWALGACVLAYLVLRRIAWARIVLIISASCAAACLSLASVATPLLVLPLAAAAAAIGLLARGDVSRWLSAR
ncbi:MAG: hypothetical protein QM572_02185, partial [Nocardioides sp.]|uniref:hypothetical protein n=1 Tax=Nocardioides sp. TaxID=35761 RepID=UPI0039E35011